MRPPLPLLFAAILLVVTASCLEVRRQPALQDSEGDATRTGDVPGEDVPCAPDCVGRECGDDGCGGSCGTCPGAAPACTGEGLCCLPACEGKACGDDGCDGSCGACEAPLQCREGSFAVLATEDDTSVTFRVRAAVGAGPGVAAMAAGDEQTVTLQRGDVLDVQADAVDMMSVSDQSGSTVTATRPVMVFTNHEMTSVGSAGPCRADPLQEMLLPTSALGTHYLAVQSCSRGGEPDAWRIQAAADGVTLTTTPAIDGADGVTLASRGDFVQVETDVSFELTASGPVQVAQYLVGQEQTLGHVGDPAMLLLVPTARFLSDVPLAVASGYTTSCARVVRPKATPVRLDGVSLDGALFQTFGGGGWELAEIDVTPGARRFDADAPIGVLLYGYSEAASYGMLGGLGPATSE